MAQRKHLTSDEWAERLKQGERVALARAISAVENDRTDAKAVLAAVYGQAGQAQVIGITGAPGVGKSTLLSTLIAQYRAMGRKVGVVAVDPSSPISGGAILGDRIRMSEHGGDTGVFVRSLAARGHLGGLSRAAARVVDVMDAAGFDVVIVETVGTGQSEVEIMDIAQTVLVVSAPGLGDDIQAVKAGILEIADILVVNKADMPLADRTEAQLRDALALGQRGDWDVPVIKTAATTGEGIPELVEAITSHHAQLASRDREHAGRVRMRTLIAATAADLLRDRMAVGDSERIDALCDEVSRGELDFDEAAKRAAKIIADGL
jgi:LAO/AO transport system kinase